MKLHTLDRHRPMTHCHYQSVRRFSRYLEAIGQRSAFDDKRMITSRRKGPFDAVKDRLTVVTDFDRFSMDGLGGPDNLPAEMLPDRLMAETHAEDRHSSRKTVDRRKRHTGIVGRPGAGRDKYPLWTQFFFDRIDLHFIVANHFHLGPKLAKILDEVIGKRIVIVDDEQHSLRPRHEAKLAFQTVSIYHNSTATEVYPMLYKALSIALVLVCGALTNAQTAPAGADAEGREELRKEAVVFLRETLTDVGTMRSLENRISFAAEIAGLMWFHDEREARSMYGGVIHDFRDLLARYDAQINALGISPDEADVGSGFMSFMTEPTDRSRIMRRFSAAMGVRQQIAMSLAEHDPDLAFAFYNDSLSAISNPEFRKQSESGSLHFESQLIGQVAENNAAKAAQLGARSLAKGVTYQHVDLLRKIHKKDADKGAEFASAILSRLKSEKIDSSNVYFLNALIEFGGQTLEASRKPGGKRAAYSLAELRELAELLAQAILSRPGDEGASGLAYVDLIQKYSPGRAAQIRSKFRQRSSNSNSSGISFGISGVSALPPPPAPRSGNSNSNTNASSREEFLRREREAREKEERQLIEDVKKLEKRELPKEEREKIIAQARRIIMQTPGRDKKIVSLSLLASQVAKFGDKDLATEIMRDAESMVNPAPKNFQDFLLSWLLASGYANSDPDRAFPILEDTIARANETLAAFIKVGEFIDVAEEMIQDGEVQVGAFGGRMVRGLTQELGMADSTIQVLARADFARTKGLTNRFDRTEIRILAKMMVLRAVLDAKPPRDPADFIGPSLEGVEP